MLIKKSLTWELSGEKICHLAWWVRKWLLEASTWGNVIKDLLLLCASCHHLFIADYASSTPWKIDLEATAQSFFSFQADSSLRRAVRWYEKKIGEKRSATKSQTKLFCEHPHQGQWDKAWIHFAIGPHENLPQNNCGKSKLGVLKVNSKTSGKLYVLY